MMAVPPYVAAPIATRVIYGHTLRLNLIRPTLCGVRRVHNDVPVTPVPDPQLGGYPQLPNESNQRRPALGWWDMQYRRNFGETLHEQDEALNMFSPDVPPVPPAVALRQFGYAVLIFVGFCTILNYVKPDPPMLRRVYPHDGLLKDIGGLEANKARTESLEDE